MAVRENNNEEAMAGVLPASPSLHEDSEQKLKMFRFYIVDLTT